MTRPAIRELDRVTIVATLGMRFWDGLSAQIVSDGLLVNVYPAKQPRRAVPAFATRSGVFVVRHVPGLRAIEGGAGDAEFWATLDTPSDVVVEVSDQHGRFVPFSLRTSAPQRGQLIWSGAPTLSPLGSPASATAWVPLFSAATRPVPGGVGVIRAQLWDPLLHGGRGGPAASAVLETLLPGQPSVRSIADSQGRVALLFPYPTPPVESLSDGLGSPVSPMSPLAGPPPGPLTEQAWTLAVRAAYSPVDSAPWLPDLADTLEQSPAVIWADVAQTRELTEMQLQFGRETVLRSVDDSGRTRPSVLLVQAGSPL